MGCVESKQSLLCDLEHLLHDVASSNGGKTPSTISSTSSATSSSTSSSSKSSNSLWLLKNCPEHAQHVYHTPPNNASDALPIEKGGKKKKLRAENRALQAELTRLKSLQDNHDAEMQRMRKELEQNRKEQRGESDVSIHQNDKIAELNHENWSLKEENSSLMDLLQRSQQDTDFKETEIERLKSDLDGT